jgi:rod shape-determining protein MreB
MIVDIGGGTTEVAIISLNGIVRSNSVRTAGDSMDGAIEKYVYEQYNLLIGPRMSEDIKIQIGSSYPMDEEKTMPIKGRDDRTNIPKTITINSQEIREALRKPLSEIVEAIKTVFKECPPELSGDLIDRGIHIAGGGALLKGIDKTISEETSLPVTIVPEPLHSVARGTGTALDRGYLD